MSARARRKFPLIGVDEAGRGPLAGPVAVAAVWIGPQTKLSFTGLRDSKKLSEKNREVWFAKMKAWQSEGQIRFAVCLVSNTTIDEKGIVPAVSLGVRRCLGKIHANPKKDGVLLDGALHAPKEFVKQKTIIRGDEKISVISLASVAAKVTRDRKMVQLAQRYSHYGFHIHKGYGTLSHRKAIKKYGLSDIHRKSFTKQFDKKKVLG